MIIVRIRHLYFFSKNEIEITKLKTITHFWCEFNSLIIFYVLIIKMIYICSRIEIISIIFKAFKKRIDFSTNI